MIQRLPYEIRTPLLVAFDHDQVGLLACLSYHLHLAARGEYPAARPHASLDDLIARLIGLNDIGFRIAQVARGTVVGESEYPPEAFIKMIEHHAAAFGVMDLLVSAGLNALSDLNRR